jgi:hypothetical protein
LTSHAHPPWFNLEAKKLNHESTGHHRTAAMSTATRVKHARRSDGVCPRCHTIMMQGQQIGLVPGLGWVHTACLVRRQPMIGPNSEA